MQSGVARILIIDDDTTLRETMLMLLSEAGHGVVGAVDGLEGLQLFRAEPADLIITDLHMPSGGLSTIKALRAEFPKLAIIAISGAGKSRLEMARALGADRTLMKPFSGQELTAAVAEALGTATA